MSQQDTDNCKRLEREGKTSIATSLGDKLKAAGVKQGQEGIDFITIRFTIDKDGELADAARS